MRAELVSELYTQLENNKIKGKLSLFMLEKSTYRLRVETMVLVCCLFRSKKESGKGRSVDHHRDKSVESI